MTTKKIKPFFLKDNFCLYNDDCLKVMKAMPDNYVDVIFADPPYNLSNGGFTVHAGKMVSVNKGEWDRSRGVQEDFEFHFEWLKEARRILKPEGTLWVSGTYHSIYQCGYAIQLLDYKILNDISWFKPNASPNLSGRFFTASHETLIWSRKDKKSKHYFDYKISKEGDWLEDSLKKPSLQMRSVWSIHPPKKEEKIFGKHPTQKPLALLKRIVLTSLKPDGVILDPFSGSSTTGIATLMSGQNRKFIGIEKERQYINLSIERYNKLKQTIL